MFSYPYERSRSVLETLRRDTPIDPTHGVRLKFANPLNGDYALPTIAAYIQLMPKGLHSQPYRSTEGRVFVVAEGSGTAQIANETYMFKKDDIFVAPNWCWYSFGCNEDTVLFSYSDRPILEKVGLWREQNGNA